MILSASRRTDIPHYYFPWFANRLREGYVLSRNPINPQQVSHIPLSPEVVDCIVFWTKNPAPMLGSLEALTGYRYYVQFTLNPYGADLESALPPMEQRLETFARLAERIGPERVVWRLSPLVLTARYDEAFHLDSFAQTARRLRGLTRQCKLSFVDFYQKNRQTLRALGVENPAEERKAALARRLAAMAAAEDIHLSACGNLDLNKAGLEPEGCIDRALIERLSGANLPLPKDSGQPADCYCVKSIDIGAYDSCPAGCAYCYANHSRQLALRRQAMHNPASPLLFGEVGPQDRVTLHAARSNLDWQMRL